ncbi:MAG: ATP-binding protein [Methanobrevibacter sp.]|jgi:predicted ATP-dependent endonuclease of OLD family|nr:ATP-binding protein [Candidatus Methanovirga meridionalis]
MKDLILEIKNIGIINKAEIKINKINIIAGKNASGKTTSSKLLYSFLITLSDEEKFLYDDKFISSLKRFNHDIFMKLNNIDSFESENYSNLKKSSNVLKALINDFNFIIDEEKIALNKIIEDFDKYLEALNYLESNGIEKRFKDIKIAWNLKESNSNEYYSELLKSLIEYEFGNKKENLINQGESWVKLYENDIFEFESSFPIGIGELKYKNKGFLINDVFYIDTPYLFDFYKSLFRIPSRPFYNQSYYFHHQSLLRRLKSQNEPDWNFSKESNLNLKKMINDVIDGTIYYDDKINDFRFKKGDEDFAIKNTAAGEKSIGIIQSLIYKELDTNSLIIMDEPEVHLHPEWQLKLAEIIVLLSKENDIAFYINSHSPQFIEAIDTYSMYYEVHDTVNYYLTENSDENPSKFNINPVEQSDLVKIYNHLGDPYDKLDEIRGKIKVRNISKVKDGDNY